MHTSQKGWRPGGWQRQSLMYTVFACPLCNRQVEESEYELEELGLGGGKKNKKPPPRVAELEEVVGRHKEHMGRLEKVRLFATYVVPYRPLPAMSARAYIHTCSYAHMHTQKCRTPHTRAHTCTHTYTHVHTHTQVLRCIDNETIHPDELEDLKADMEMYLVSLIRRSHHAQAHTGRRTHARQGTHACACIHAHLYAHIAHNHTEDHNAFLSLTCTSLFRTHTHTHTHTLSHTHTHTHIHTHTHTHTHSDA